MRYGPQKQKQMPQKVKRFQFEKFMCKPFTQMNQKIDPKLERYVSNTTEKSGYKHSLESFH